jgi:hypothetical protein
MEAQITILVDSMQMLQTGLQNMEVEPKPRPYNETQTCFNCIKQGHLAKDCKEPQNVKLVEWKTKHTWKIRQVTFKREQTGSAGANPTHITEPRLKKLFRSENNNTGSKKKTPSVVKFSSHKRRKHRRSKQLKIKRQSTPEHAEENTADIDHSPVRICLNA